MPEPIVLVVQFTPLGLLAATSVPTATNIEPFQAKDTNADVQNEVQKLRDLRAEYDALKSAPPPSGASNADLFAYHQAIAAKAQEINTQQAVVFKAETKTFDKLLPQLQAATPQQVSVTFSSGISQREQNRMLPYIEQTIGMAKQRADGSPMTIKVEYTRSRTNAGVYDYRTNTLYIRPNGPTHTVVHETLHAMQHQLGYGVATTDAYGDARTAGLKPVYTSGMKTYAGLTDHDYSYRVYDSAKLYQNVGKWCEILTTTFHNMSDWGLMRDRNMIELVTGIIKDGSK